MTTTSYSAAVAGPVQFTGRPGQAGLPGYDGPNGAPSFTTVAEAATDLRAVLGDSSTSSICHFFFGLLCTMVHTLLSIAVICLGVMVPFTADTIHSRSMANIIAGIFLMCISTVFSVTGALHQQFGGEAIDLWYKRLIASSVDGLLSAPAWVYTAASTWLDPKLDGTFYQCLPNITGCKTCGLVVQSHLCHQENGTIMDAATCASHLRGNPATTTDYLHPLHPVVVAHVPPPVQHLFEMQQQQQQQLQQLFTMLASIQASMPSLPDLNVPTAPEGVPPVPPPGSFLRPTFRANW
ncbi:hypothetical protein OEZ85_012013 [Tetradesmus obliquus]|uniref:Uncharacterized protein n=1 Tax=Tetradesmus obliquus TaxID=3088 RepID=A0ABY8TUH0_TETOB|nr:hypothetical protein OEZ85_012013 [Tetradesmus obliquus]